MKNHIIKLSITFTLIQSLWAFGGFGMYGNTDMFTATAPATSSGNVTVTPQSMSGSNAFGVFVYLDVLPFVDLEADIEFAFSTYDFESKVLGQSSIGSFPFARISQFYTVRREIIGASIPFLAKVQIYGGAGFNMHTVTPSVTVNFIEKAFSTLDLEDAANQDFASDAILNTLVDYMVENKISSNGYHIQLGAQGKLLMFNFFANARYTIAEDVIPGENGFVSIWTGLAFGF